MTNQKDRQIDLQGEDNGLFTDDDNKLQTKEEYEEDKGNHGPQNEKVTPLEPDVKTPTLSDKITINANNEDLVTLVKDDDTSYENDQAQ